MNSIEAAKLKKKENEDAIILLLVDQQALSLFIADGGGLDMLD